MSEYSLALCGCELSHLLTLFWRKYIDFGENTLITVRHTVQTSNCCCLSSITLVSPVRLVILVQKPCRCS